MQHFELVREYRGYTFFLGGLLSGPPTRIRKLLYHWLEHNGYVGHHEPKTSEGPTTNGASISSSGKAKKGEGRYEMVSKTKNFSEVITLSGK